MAMIGNLRPASDGEIARLLANPVEITRFLYGSDANGSDRVVLNKAWHAIHFVLNGSRLGGDEPLNFLVDQGTPVGEVDVGYGPARVLTSEQVRRLARALTEIGPDVVAERVDLKRFDDEAIYPGNWQQNGYSAQYVVEHYADMRQLVRRAAEQGQGLILYIN
jgi:uncharacterized protein DUF1877